MPNQFLDSEVLAGVCAGLNLIATGLLLVGFILVKRGRVEQHKKVMISAFIVSSLFLVVYLTNYGVNGNVKFPVDEHPVAARFYYPFLILHVALAALVPFLALRTIYLGLRDRRPQHRRWAKWTFPVWLYVSISGLVVYVMIRWLYPPA
jgi:uncharacterized membrane protein YozB (DUF420 family)